ncbi:hypothetical protein TorRG33x02_127140, partial [Trema orientale]
IREHTGVDGRGGAVHADVVIAADSTDPEERIRHVVSAGFGSLPLTPLQKISAEPIQLSLVTLRDAAPHEGVANVVVVEVVPGQRRGSGDGEVDAAGVAGRDGGRLVRCQGGYSQSIGQMVDDQSAIREAVAAEATAGGAVEGLGEGGAGVGLEATD